MKKRKELDALLMNGKKSRPKRTKDGHELLQNSESESNSSELDEYVVQTRRQTTRRRKGVICSICLRLLVFILVVGCITVTAGVMWMHFELKNDLDSLRKELIQVQSMVDTSQSQSSSIINLNKEMQSLPSLTTKVGLLNETISGLNASIVSLKANILSLQERAETHTVQEARNLEDINQFKLHLKSLKADAASNQTSLTNLINALKVNLSTLQTQVTVITQDPSKTQPAVEPVTAANAIKSLQKSIDSLNSSFSEINATMFNLSAEVTSIEGPVAPPPVVDTTGVVNLREVLDSLWRNVSHLNEVINQELSSDEPPDATVGDATPAEWQSDVAERLVEVENQIKTLLGPDSPSSGNSSSADELYAAFKEEIRGSLTSLKADHQGVTLRLDANENELKDLRDQVVKLDIRVVDLEVNPLLTGGAVLIPNQTDIAGGVPPAVTPTPQSESQPAKTPTLAPPPPAATLEQEGKNVTSTDGQASDGKPPAEPTSKAGPEPAGPKTELSGEQPPAAETPSEGAPVNDTSGDKKPETAAGGSPNGTSGEETEGTTVGETKETEPEGTTSGSSS